MEGEKLLTQHEKDLGLARAVCFFHPKEKVLEWLKMGANTNCTDVELTKKYGPMRETLLAMAVRFSNRAVVPLLLEYGANPEVESLDGNTVIMDAITKGSADITEALLGKYPKLAELIFDSRQGHHRENLLHRCVFSLSPLSMVAEGDWGSNTILHEMIDYFLEKPGAQRPTQALRVGYPGNIRVAEALLDACKSLVLMKTEEGFSPLDVVFNPRAYRHCFFDVNGFETIRCLTLDDDPNPDVLSFEIDLANRTGFDRFLNRTDETPDFRPPVTVIYDFRPLQAALTARAERLPEYQALKLAGQVHGTVQVLGHKQRLLENNLETLHARVESLYQEVQNDHPHFEEIRHFKQNPLQALFYENTYKHLAIMMGAYQAISTGLFQRNKSTRTDMASAVMSFVAGHIPSPFGIPFELLASGATELVNRSEEQRYKRIIALLPAHFHPMAQELAFQLTLFIEQGLKQSSLTLEELSQQQVEGLAKRSFVIAIHTIHTIRDKDIDSSIHARQSKESQLIDKIIKTVMDSTFLRQLISEQAQELGKRPAFTPAYTAERRPNQGHADTQSRPERSQKRCVIM